MKKKKFLFLIQVLLLLHPAVMAMADDITPKWTCDFRRFANNMTLTGIVLLNEIDLKSEMIEVGAFYGDDDCRGRTMLMPISGTINKYLCFLMIYGETDDNLSFRIYDHSTGKEYTGKQIIQFSINAKHGNVLTPYELLFEDKTFYDLQDGVTFTNSVDLENKDVRFTRGNWLAGKYGTFVIPFSASVPEDVSVYRFKQTGDNVIKFDEVDAIVANTPYLFETSKDMDLVIEATNTTIKSTTGSIVDGDDQYQFVGTYATMNAVADIMYGIYNNQFVQAGTNVSIPAFRAYLHAGKQNARSLKIDIDDTVGIDAVSSDEMEVYVNGKDIFILSSTACCIPVHKVDGSLVCMVFLTEGINTLSGMTSGIYLISGQKIVVE